MDAVGVVGPVTSVCETIKTSLFTKIEFSQLQNVGKYIQFRIMIALVWIVRVIYNTTLRVTLNDLYIAENSLSNMTASLCVPIEKAIGF